MQAEPIEYTDQAKELTMICADLDVLCDEAMQVSPKMPDDLTFTLAAGELGDLIYLAHSGIMELYGEEDLEPVLDHTARMVHRLSSWLVTTAHRMGIESPEMA